jgi:hypothetical protein
MYIRPPSPRVGMVTFDSSPVRPCRHGLQWHFRPAEPLLARGCGEGDLSESRLAITSNYGYVG